MASILSINTSDPPADSLLVRYLTTPGCYADCYTATVGATVHLPEFITAFYTTPLFRLERFILKQVASIPSGDHQLRQLAAAEIDQFSAWNVEARTETQLLMRDFSGRTRSWFMVAPTPDDSARTRLYFGSAVVPKMNGKSGRIELGFTFKVLLGFHKLYSRALLWAATSRLRKRGE